MCRWLRLDLAGPAAPARHRHCGSETAEYLFDLIFRDTISVASKAMEHVRPSHAASSSQVPGTPTLLSSKIRGAEPSEERALCGEVNYRVSHLGQSITISSAQNDPGLFGRNLARTSASRRLRAGVIFEAGASSLPRKFRRWTTWTIGDLGAAYPPSRDAGEPMASMHTAAPRATVQAGPRRRRAQGGLMHGEPGTSSPPSGGSGDGPGTGHASGFQIGENRPPYVFRVRRSRSFGARPHCAALPSEATGGSLRYVWNCPALGAGGRLPEVKLSDWRRRETGSVVGTPTNKDGS